MGLVTLEDLVPPAREMAGTHSSRASEKPGGRAGDKHASSDRVKKEHDPPHPHTPDKFRPGRLSDTTAASVLRQAHAVVASIDAAPKRGRQTQTKAHAAHAKTHALGMAADKAGGAAVVGTDARGSDDGI